MKLLSFTKRKNNKKGNYILEAVITMPIFIAAIVALMSIVPIAASCENIVFAVSDEMRLESVKSAFRKNPAALPAKTEERVLSENPRMNRYDTQLYRYLYRENGIEDLFRLDFFGEFSQNSPAAVFDTVRFSGRITARAFTGKLHRRPPSSESRLPEDDKFVYIFPEWGKRYHGKNCTYVKAACEMVYLSQETQKRYAPCKLCDAASARIGAPVFCFRQSGSVYHLAECRTVDRYYVEVKRSEAVSKGYSPCLKCGGG